MKVVTGHQPVYLPWLGLFHKIALADTFVFMDDVQYLRKDWNNRNRVKGPQGAFWLNVPVRVKGSGDVLLRDVRIASEGFGSRSDWQRSHWLSLQTSYGKAPFWSEHAAFFETLYCEKRWDWLAELNETILTHLLDVLDIRVEFIRAGEYGFSGRKSALVLDHCLKLGADVCVLGAHGRDYIVDQDFRAAGVSTYFQDYVHPVYPQRFGAFESHLSAVDLLFNCGPQSREILLSGNVTRSDLLTPEPRHACPAGILHDA